jgi:glycerol-3-phosphate O-acyltransferase
MSLSEKLKTYLQEGIIDQKAADLITYFYSNYSESLLAHGGDSKEISTFLDRYLSYCIEAIQAPYSFENCHKALSEPIDYVAFARDFVRPLMAPESSFTGIEAVKKMDAQLKAGENVVFVANHQSEPDPQIISLLLKDLSPKIANETYMVAGHRVTTDPMAIPFSLGTNLLCIYSKKHIENPPEEKANKQRYNQKTMGVMKELLSKGGTCIYIALSGGRDRMDENGEIRVEDFDPQSTEMLLLTARRSNKPTHFYPLSLFSYHLMPPPKTLQKNLGEWRTANVTPVKAAFGDEIDIEDFPGNDLSDKVERRQARAKHFWSLVKKNYDRICI